MRRTFASAVFIAGITVAVVAFAAGSDHHVRVPFEAENGSHASGWVNVVAKPSGGTLVQIQAQGLEPNTTYTSFYYESEDCSAPADKLVTFTTDQNGRIATRGETDEDLDEIGTISIRTGSDYGDLMACAVLHPKE